MSTRSTPFPKAVLAALLFSASPVSPVLFGADLPPVVERYEAMLVRSPQKGTAFDKVYQHFFEGEGLEKLAQRWSAKTGGDDAAVYDVLLGLLAERQGKVKEAREAYARAAGKMPGDYRIWAALGNLEAGEGKMPAAIAALEKALAQNPPVAERAALYRQLAQSQRRNFDTAPALATWQKMEAEFPDDPFVLEEVAEALLEADRFDEAKKTYEKLRDLAGTDPFKRIAAMIRLAQLEERRGKNKEALAIYEAAIAEASETSWIHREVRTRIEEIYRRQDDLPGLVAYYEKWLETHPRDVQAATRLSGALVELNKKADAVAWLQKAVEWAPDRADVKVELATRLRETGQPGEAVTILLALTQAQSEELGYWEMLGEAQWESFEKSKDAAQKTAALESWKRLAPEATNDSARVSRLADLLRNHRLTEEALAQYERAVRLAPEAVELRERWAEFLFEAERPDAARAVLNGIVEGKGATAGNYVRLAALQRRHDDSKGASASVESGLKLDPQNFELLSLKWQMLIEAKQWDAALALFDALLAAAPNDYFVEDLEARQVQALVGSEKLDATRQALVDRMDRSDAPALTEREWRLLIRLSLQSRQYEIVWKALERAARQHPDSVPLARLEVQAQREGGSAENRVKALRRLLALQPKQAAEILEQIILAWQQAQQLDTALEVASEFIKNSPANARGYLLYANLCFLAQRPDEGFTKLREAIKLSDQANEIRLRLAAAYLEAGENARALAVYQEAFEAEEDQGKRLSLMKPLAEAYFTEGRLDELITRFKERQKGEENGWRYALYLAEIYQQAQDYGAARRELAKAIAARPRDGSLLRQAIALARAEENKTELVRYLRMLIEAEPSAAQRRALVEALMDDGQLDDAVDLIRRNPDEFFKDRSFWRKLLPKFRQSDKLASIGELYEAELRRQGESGETRLAAAEFFLAAGKYDLAKPILWKLFENPPEPPAPASTPTPAPTPIPGGRAALMAGAVQRRASDLATRLQTASPYINASWELIPLQNGGSRFYNSYYNTPQTTSETYRLAAIAYLGRLAQAEGTSEAFLADLDRRITPHEERLLVFSLLQAREFLIREIEVQAKSQEKNDGLDQFCLLQLMQSQNYQQASGSDPKKVFDLMEAFHKKLGDANPYAAHIDQLRFARLKAGGKEAEAKQLADGIIAKANRNDFGSLITTMVFAMRSEQYEQAEKLAAEFFELGKKTPASQWRQMGTYPLGLLSELVSREGQQERAATLAMAFLRASYPDEPPKKTLVSRSRFYGNQEGLPPTRFFDAQQTSMIEPLASRFKQAGMLPKALALLAEQVKELPAPQKIYPRLLRVLFLWSGGEKEQAATEVLALAKEQPEDDLNLLAAAVLGGSNRYDDALAMLASVNVRFGDDFRRKELQVLRYALQLKKNDLARSAAARLSGMRLEYNERNELSAALETLGMKEEAAKVAARPASNGGGNSVYEQRQRQVNALEAHLKKKEAKEGIALARQLLAADPLASPDDGNWHRNRALHALGEFKALPTYIEELRAQLRQSPDSVRINYLLAEASESGGYTEEDVNTGIKAPVWLKLVRAGGKVTGFTSADGVDWKRCGEAAIDLPETVEAGIAVTSKSRKKAFEAVLQNVTPAVDGAWKARAVGKIGSGGALALEPGGIVKVKTTGGDIYGRADAFYFVSAPLKGDGELVAQVRSPSQTPVKIGLMLRAGDEGSAINAALVYRGNDGVGFQARRLAANPEPYLRKLAALQPENLRFRQELAQWLSGTDRNSEAIDLYEKILDTKPSTFFQNPYQLVEAYKRAEQLPRLAGRMLLWKPEPVLPGQPSYGPATLCERLGEALLEKNPELAEKVSRKGLERAEPHNQPDLRSILIRSLLRTDRRQEVIEELALLFIPPEPKPNPMGFFVGNQGIPRAAWVQGGSYGGDRGLSNPVVSLLGKGIDRESLLGLNARLKERLKQKPQEPGLQTISTLLAVKCRETERLAALPAWLKAQQGNGRHEVGEIAAMMEIARELKAWPGHEKLAIQVLASLQDKLLDESQFVHMAMIDNLCELALTQSQVGDRAGAARTLDQLGDLISERIVNPNPPNRGNRTGFNADQTMKVLALMLRERREAAFLDLYHQLRGSAVGLKLGGWTLDEEQKQIYGTCEKIVAIPWLLDDGDPAAKTRVVYEIRGIHPRLRGAVNRLTMSRGCSIPMYEKPRTLKFLYGRTPEELKPLGTLQTKSAFGTWSAKVPPGLGYLAIVIEEAGPDGKPVEITSPAVAVARGKNLVKNPNFDGLAKRPSDSNPFAIPGWTDLPPGFWKLTAEGPRSGQPFVQFFPNHREEWTIAGEKVAIEPGRDYFQSAWLRAMNSWDCGIQFGRRYLNAEGTELKTTYLPAYNAFNWRRHWQKLSPVEEKGADLIPPDAKFVQPVLKGRLGADFTNLFLTALPAVPKEKEAVRAAAVP